MLHPSPAQIFHLWQAFLDNVNPLAKIIHAPTLQQQILQASNNLHDLSRPMQALMFVIYTFAVTSMNDNECERMFPGETRNALIERWRYASQAALVAAGVVKTTDMVVLQAFTLFLVSGFPSGLSCLQLYYNSNSKVVIRCSLSNVAYPALRACLI